MEAPLRTACGFVLVREGSAGIEYLALTNAERGEPGLPKGHADPGETEMETALRETVEETGLDDLEVLGDFERNLRYTATRKGETYPKRVVYYLARARSGEVVLSPEHSSFEWLPLRGMLDAMPFEVLEDVIRDAALFLKDPALFDIERKTEAEADLHLASLPEASESLLAHLRGGARLARGFAQSLADAGMAVDVEATAVGTLLHDVGRALGEHADHQRAGLRHLRETALAPYAFACISHFTKGAAPDELLEAGVAEDVVADFRKMVDTSSLTWEERCAALADACMKGGERVVPAERFADLRARYDAPKLIDLQERRTEAIRRSIADVTRADPIRAAGLLD